MLTIDTQELKPLRKAEKGPQLTVYRASAGSGKTFTLAVEYISLLMKDPTAYRNILAVTFTNKATAEMKERILSQLYGISVGDKGSESYLAEVCKKTGLAEEVIRKKAGEALQLIIHDYTRFHVETIDSFSVSVMRNLAKELSVGTNMNIDLDSEGALGEAVDTMIENLNEGVDILNWLSDYIMERIDEGGSWRVFDSIKKFAEQIFNEKFVKEGETLREQLKNPATIDEYKKTLSDKKDEITKELKVKGDKFFAVLRDNNIETNQLSRGDTGPAVTYFSKLQNGAINDISFGKMLSNMLTSAEAWTTKTAEERVRVIALANSDLIDILNDAEEYRKQYISCSLSLEQINNLRLLAEIDKQMNELNHLNNRYLLADINKLLHTFVKESDTPFVFEKIGTTISNIMIDEFQDTSRLQWDNFKPLIAEGLANGNDSLIVGDVKQSIYRWRNGDWKILNEELRNKFGTYEIKEMVEEPGYKDNKNYRSAQNIVTFNNEFFVTARSYLAGRCPDAGIPDSSPLENAYNEVNQTSVKTSERGYVKVSILPASLNGDDYTKTTIMQLADQVCKLKNEHHIAEKDIAILVRKKKHIKQIAEFFSKERGLRLVSDEAFRLDASVAIGIIVDAMRCLSLPKLIANENKLLLAPLAIAYQREVNQRTIDNDILLSSVGDILEKYLPVEFSSNLESLRLMPIYELAERLYTIFGLAKIEGQDGYVCAFFDAVSDYCSNHPSELSTFINYWDETLFEKTIPIGEVDGIRILTIHKAKGLEFHTVLVPFCDWTLDVESHPSDPHKIWCKTGDAEPYNGLDLLSIRYKEAMASSIYADEYSEERMQLCVDNVNLLYVAFTRAKENLFVWASQDANPKTAKGWNVARVLKDTLTKLENNSIVRYSKDPEENDIFERGTLQVPEEKDNKQETNRLLEPPDVIPMKMLTTENTFEFQQSNRSAAFIAGKGEGNQYIDRGLLLHDFFARINTIDDVPQAAQQLLDEGIISGDEKVEQLKDFALTALHSIEDKHWFDGSCQLFNECSIIYTREGHVETRRPDRVMMKDGSVVVLDYKFAKKQSEHHQQVREYMKLMNKMGYHNVKGYLWYFDLEENKKELEEVNNG